MKKMNETQKKWALTACLATVLSFNFILGSQGSPYGTANFASEKDEAEGAEVEEQQSAEPKFAAIITEKGKFKVKYIKDDDDKTVAIVPKKVEGEFCWDKCGTKYILPTNFESSKDDLELALRKAIAASDSEESPEEDLDEVETPKRKKKKTSIAREEQVEEEDEEEIEEDKDLIALEKKCDRKEDDSRMTCFANGLTRILKDKKKEHSKENVLALYKKEIEPGLIDSLTDVRNSDRRENGQVILENMLGTVAKKYTYLRERMVKLSALVVIKAQQVAQNKLRQAEQLKATNPDQALRLQAEGYNRRSLAENMATNLDYTLQSGLENAQFNRLIDENKVVDLYTNHYVDVVNPIIQGMRENPLGYAISSSLVGDRMSILTDSYGNPMTDPSAGPIGELRSSGRGVIVITNGLGPANVIPASAPRITTPNGVSPQVGTATIQVIPASQVPTNIHGIRGRN